MPSTTPERARALLDSVPFVAYECALHAPWGELFISAHVERHFGWAPALFYADPCFWREIVHPDDRDGVDAALARVDAEGQVTFEYRVRHRDGRWIWCRDHAIRIGEGADAYIGGSWFDIDVEVAERARAEWRGRLLTAISQAQAGHIARLPADTLYARVLDDLLALSASQIGFIAAVEHDGGAAQLTRRAARGAACDALAGMPTHPWFAAVVEEGERRHAVGAAAKPAWPAFGADGPQRAAALLPVRHAGQTVGLVGLGDRDDGYSDELLDHLLPLLALVGQLLVADHHARLRERERHERDRLALAMERLDSAVMIADRDDRLVWVNAGFERLTGYPAAEALGQRPADLLSGPGSASDELDSMAARLHAGAGYEGEVLNYRRDGSAYWARILLDPLFDEDGAAQGFIGIHSDVSDEHIERSRRLELANRLDKLARLVPGMIYQYQETADGRFLFPWASEGIREIYELTPAAVAADAAQVFERLHPDDVGKVVDSIARSRESLDVWRCEYRVILPSRGERVLYGMATPECDREGGTLWHGHITDITERKARELAESTTRAQLQQLIDSATEVSIIAADTDGVIRLFNRGAENLLGYSAADVVGLASQLRFHDPDEIADRARAASAEAGRALTGFDVLTWRCSEARPDQRMWTYIRRDGSRLQVSVSVSAVYDAAGELTGYLGIATDRTPQIQAERALRASEAKFRNLYESANIAILRTRLDDGRVLDANRALQTLTGHRREQLAQMSEHELIPAEYAAEVARQTDELRWNGRCGPFAAQYRRSGGRRVDVLVSRILAREEDGSEVVWSMVQDISAQKRNEAIALESARALAVHVKRTRAILDNTADGIVSFDADGRIDSLNAAARRLFGLDDDASEGRSILDFVALAERDGLADALAGLTAVPGTSSEQSGIAADGRAIALEMSLARVEGSDALYVAVLRDITARKQVEQMKNQFIAIVSHELRTPLTSIRGAVGLVASGGVGALPAAAAPLLQVALRNSERLGQLIDDLLDMEKLIAGQLSIAMQPTGLAALAAQAIELNRGLEQARSIRLSLSCASADEALVDADRLLQVLTNLISNAAKFSPENGTVTLSLTRRGDWLRLAVSDEGPGVPAEFRDRIFDKFSQADSTDTRKIGGSGLGLSISRELVQRMHGRIGFDSPPGQGATFWCEFRALQDASAPLRIHPAPSRDRPDGPDLRALVAAGLARPCALAESDFVMVSAALATDRSGDRLAGLCRRAAALGRPLLWWPLLPAAGADGDATDWRPPPMAQTQALAWMRALLDCRSDHRGRVLLLAAGDVDSAALAAGLDARARLDRVDGVTGFHLAFKSCVYDLLVIDLGDSAEPSWPALAALRQRQPAPPVLLLQLDRPKTDAVGERRNLEQGESL